MSAQSTSKQPRRFSWYKILVFISVGFNIIIIAALIGFAFRAAHKGAPYANMNNFGVLIRALPSDDRQILRDKMRKDQPFHKAQRAQRRALNAALLEVLKADPFDVSALEKLQQDHIKIRHMGSARFDKYWLELLVAMSPQERANYAKRIEEHSKRFKNFNTARGKK